MNAGLLDLSIAFPTTPTAHLSVSGSLKILESHCLNGGVSLA